MKLVPRREPCSK